MKNILFVDDERRVLDGLRRKLRPMRKEWRMSFVESGGAALELLESHPFDVIVSDMRMPGMDGEQLLGEVRRRFPQVLRIAQSGYSSSEIRLESARATHQFLSKPCNADTLKGTVDRLFALENLLRREDLNRVVACIDVLPGLPALYTEIMNEVASPDCTLGRVGEIISKDPAMTAKILQLVNSEFCDRRRHIVSPAQATRLLGLDVIRALVLVTKVFYAFDQKVLPFDVESLLQHSIQVGALARQIAESGSHDRKICDHALMAGMLHDVGKMVLASNLTDGYKQALDTAKQESVPLWKVELQMFGCTHGEVGAYLLGLWGLPNPVLEAVAYHYDPHHCVGEGFIPLTAVHIANVILDPGDPEMDIAELDEPYLERLCIKERLPEWLRMRDELLQQGYEKNKRENIVGR